MVGSSRRLTVRPCQQREASAGCTSAEESAKTLPRQAAGAPHSGAMQPTVLVVEDEPDIVALLRDFLGVAGFGVLTAGDAAAAVDALAEQQVDCVLLDVMLPGSSGFDLCRQIREASDVPLLFLSARGDDSDKLRGLGLAADDYIVKSATPAEVVARVKAVLRRAPPVNGNGGAADMLRFGELTIDLAAHEVEL